jgi:hypothetical protein
MLFCPERGDAPESGAAGSAAKMKTESHSLDRYQVRLLAILALINFVNFALISRGQVDKITGGELLQLFRSLGMRVSVRTTISVAERGKVVSLADKLKQGEQ